ncbi:hypothetical protein Hdeb2414_s0612g00923981 [Helianthus debilis subsp. tardiflorus]
MVKVRHFEFVCRTMHVEPTVPRFRVFHQMHCTQGFYSFVQRVFTKKNLYQPPKSFHDWKQKIFFIKAGVIPVRMVLRGKEDIPTETLRTPVDENWYQDLKDVPNIALPEKALVGAGMSLNWKMDRDDKPVYTEDGHSKFVSLYVVAFKREGGRMGTIKKKPEEELWYHRIVRNFVLPRDADLSVQPAAGAGELLNLGVGPEKKKRATISTSALKRSETVRIQPLKARNVGEKKGTRRSSVSRCDYVVVSDSLEGLTPVVIMREPKPEPRDSADIPPSNPDDPINLESSPEHLVQRGASKRKQTDTDAEGQPPKKVQKKKITRRGNLDAFVTEPVPEVPVTSIPTNLQSVVNEELPSTPPHASVADQLKPIEVADDGVEKTVEVEKPADVDPGVNLKKGDTFADWHVCQDWLQGIFPHGEIKFQENRSCEKAYQSYVAETASHVSTTHRIVREWYNMHKEQKSFVAA